MSLYIPIGSKGSGKNVIMTMTEGRDTRPSYSNYFIDSVRYRPLDVENLQDVNGALVLGDEWYNIANARNSMSKENRASAWILNMARKKKNDFMISTQLLRAIDVLWRDQCDVLIMCTREDDNYVDGDFIYYFYKNSEWHPRLKVMRLRYDDAKEHIFPYYDTDQEITPPDEIRRLSFNPINHEKEIKAAADSLLFEDWRPKEVTMALVKNFCRKHKLHSGFEEPIYIEIKGRK